MFIVCIYQDTEWWFESGILGICGEGVTPGLWIWWPIFHEQVETNNLGIILLVPLKLALSLKLPKLLTDQKEAVSHQCCVFPRLV